MEEVMGSESNYECKDGRVVVTKSLQRKRMEAMFPELFPLGLAGPEGHKTLKVVKKRLENVDFSKGAVIVSQRDLMKPVFLYAFLSLGENPHHIILNAFRLLEIYLRSDPEFVTVSELTHRVIAVYLGYSEFENKRQTDVIEQLMDMCAVRSQILWLFIKGGVSSVTAKYGGVIALAKSLGLEMVDMSSVSETRGHLIEEEI